MALVSPSPKYKGNDKNVMTWIDYLFIVIFPLITTGVGLIVVLLRGGEAKALASLWSLACLFLGGLIGFLFGVPRVLQHDAERVTEKPAAAKDDGPAQQRTFYQQQVNTNLEQISDWLTKIIVGIGLIELRRLPELLSRSSSFIARGFANQSDAQILAAGIILYFSVVGFLNSYIITRIYLAGAFWRAGTGEGGKVDVGGNKLDPIDAIRQQSVLISDLLKERVDKLKGKPADETVGKVTKTSKVQSILWVDDNPQGNAYLIDSLKASDVEVVTATSTSDALSQLNNKSFDRVITDMGRQEGNTFNQTAGITLTQEVRKINRDIPIIVFCSTMAAAKFGDAALAAGADEVTSSPTGLLQALKLES